MRTRTAVLSIFATGLMSFAASAQEVTPAAAPAATEPAAVAPAPEAAPAPAPAPAPVVPVSGKKMLLGVDLAFQLPVGNFSDETGIGLGALVRYEYKLIPKLNLTGRIGYIYSLKKDQGGLKFSVDNIPIWVGAKYFLLADLVYVGAEVGLNMLKFKAEVSYFGTTASGSDSETKLGINVGAGVLLSDFDIRAQLEFLSIGDTTDALGLMVNVGYNFWAF